jgi:hypothetical protein
MRRLWIIIATAAFILIYPLMVKAEGDGSAPSMPPVAQTLVREGDFAIKLAAALDLGSPVTEEEAEQLLVQAGIAPLNGWLSDYPMTPEIIGQLHDSVSVAASEGKVPMTADEAVKGLYAIAAQLDLPVPAGEASAPSGAQSGPDQQVISGYYYDAGPPIVTYYPPPYNYVYLYNWVPYPVWWFGFWFPGYYICNDFSTVIVYQMRTVVVSNHYIDRRSGTVVRVDPNDWPGHHGGRPRTVLRTRDGRRFLTVRDLHHNVPLGDSQRGNQQLSQGGVTSRPGGVERRWSTEAKRSAGAIYSRSLRYSNGRSVVVHSGPMRSPARREVPRSFIPSSGTQRVPGSGSGRNWSVPSSGERHITPTTTRGIWRGSNWYGGSLGPSRTKVLSTPTVPYGTYSPRGGRSVGRGGQSLNAGGGTTVGRWHFNHALGGRQSFGNVCRGRC